MISPKKSLGQNFLIDKNIISKIVNSTIIKNKNILEIGAGTGNLTEYILKNNPKEIIIIEKDKNLCEVLRKKFAESSKVKIYNEDILDFDLEGNIKSDTTIFGNLPYNISTKILINIIKFNKWPPKYDSLILMFQKEVAQRILAKENSSEYGRLSIISNYRLKIINSFDVTNNCFFPKPKVDSTVLIFKPFNKDNDKYENFEKLEYITKVIFSNKRKMINKALNKLFQNNSMISKKYDLNLKSRPSEISKKTFYKLADFYKK